MKKIYIIILSTFIFTISCKDRNSNKTEQNFEIHNKTKLDSEDRKEIKNSALENEIRNDTLLVVEILTKFFYNNDYYIPLSLKNEYSDSIAKIIRNTSNEKIFDNSIESRFKIPADITEKYFFTNHLDTLAVINKDQKIIDTVIRKNYEFYQGTIESQYVATYDSPNNLADSAIVISTNVHGLKLNKSPQPQINSRYNNRILQDYAFDYDEIFSHSTIVNKSDTISILSFGNYSEFNNYLFLIKNGKLTDSIISDYMAVSSLKAIPIATDVELTYVYNGFKPETDWFWTGLMGIDIINWKFNFYENNRIQR